MQPAPDRMNYDDASWHCGDGFPAGLAPDAGATHAGLFLAWALLADLGSDYHAVDCAEDLERLRARKLTPGRYFLAVCDGKLTDEDFDAEGNETTIDYARMMKIVLDAGYHGYVGIEYEGRMLSEPEGILATKKLLEKVRASLA